MPRFSGPRIGSFSSRQPTAPDPPARGRPVRRPRSRTSGRSAPGPNCQPVVSVVPLLVALGLLTPPLLLRLPPLLVRQTALFLRLGCALPGFCFQPGDLAPCDPDFPGRGAQDPPDLGGGRGGAAATGYRSILGAPLSRADRRGAAQALRAARQLRRERRIRSPEAVRSGFAATFRSGSSGRRARRTRSASRPGARRTRSASRPGARGTRSASRSGAR